MTEAGVTPGSASPVPANGGLDPSRKGRRGGRTRLQTARKMSPAKISLTMLSGLRVASTRIRKFSMIGFAAANKARKTMVPRAGRIRVSASRPSAEPRRRRLRCSRMRSRSGPNGANTPWPTMRSVQRQPSPKPAALGSKAARVSMTQWRRSARKPGSEARTKAKKAAAASASRARRSRHMTGRSKAAAVSTSKAKPPIVAPARSNRNNACAKPARASAPISLRRKLQSPTARRGVLSRSSMSVPLRQSGRWMAWRRSALIRPW